MSNVGAKPADDGFLARMMRPTTSSASKTHEKGDTSMGNSPKRAESRRTSAEASRTSRVVSRESHRLEKVPKAAVPSKKPKGDHHKEATEQISQDKMPDETSPADVATEQPADKTEAVIDAEDAGHATTEKIETVETVAEPDPVVATKEATGDTDAQPETTPTEIAALPSEPAAQIAESESDKPTTEKPSLKPILTEAKPDEKADAPAEQAIEPSEDKLEPPNEKQSVTETPSTVEEAASEDAPGDNTTEATDA